MKETDKRRGVRGNLIDRVVEYFDPKAGAGRMRARAAMAIAGGYFGGSKSRRSLKEWATKTDSADAALLPDLVTLRDRSYDLMRNSALARGAVNTVVTKVVGTGLTLQSRIDREVLKMSPDEATAWQKKTEREFRLWCESPDCDVARTLNFYHQQDLVFRSALVAGDTFVLQPYIKRAGNPYGIKIQVVEADRITNRSGAQDTNKLAGGVELDEYGAPVNYHILKAHPGDLGFSTREWDVVPAFGTKTGRRNVIHLYRKLRPGQTRGEPYLAPVIEPLKQLDRYTEAEISAAVISGMFSVFITTEGTGIDAVASTETGSKTTDEDLKLASGLVAELAPGEKIETANPGRPNTAFDPFVMSILRQIGVALELPFEVLIKHFTSSYTAARAALLEAWAFFRGRREWLADGFCQVVYETWLAEAIASGRVAAPGFFADPLMRKAYCGTQWVGDPPGYLDPMKEVEAAEKRLEIGITTLAAESVAYDGVDWPTKHEQQVEEMKQRKVGGLHQEPKPPQPAAPKKEYPSDPEKKSNEDT